VGDGFTWAYSDTLPGGVEAYRPDEDGMKRLHGFFDAEGTGLTALGRRIHALLTGTEPDDD
jgi:hypothetical protein